MRFQIRTGARAAAAGLLLCLGAASVAVSETVMTVDGIEVDSAVVDIFLEMQLKKPASQATPEERSALLEHLADLYRLSLQPQATELAADPRAQAQLEIQRRGLLAQLVAQDFLANNEATEEEILAEYQKQAENDDSLQFKARHILVETQATAIDLIAQLGAGADFASLAQAHSTGPTGPNGGDLGWFGANQMVKPFSDAVVALGDGEFTSEPVQTQYGWHVILREDSRPAEPPPLENVRDTIKTRVEQTKFQNYLQQLRDAEAE